MKAAKSAMANNSNAPSENTQQSNKRFCGNCNKCGQYGHMGRNCPRKDEPAMNVNADPPADQDPTSDNGSSKPSQASQSSQFSQAQLPELMQKISRGEATVALVKQRTKQSARVHSGRLPPRRMKSRSRHRFSLLADGQLRVGESAATDVNRESAYGLCGDAHIGEASHPEPRKDPAELPQTCGSGPLTAVHSPDEPMGKHSGDRKMPATEAEHPHASSLLVGGQPFGEYKGNRVQNIVISLCDGIGGALLALNTVGAAMTR